MVSPTDHTTFARAVGHIEKMKNRLDPRHKKREETIKSLFSISFQPKKNLKSPSKATLVGKVVAKQEKIDEIISNAASEWPIKQINRIDLAVLRLAIFELIFEPTEPSKVVIDEAIELAKSFGSEKSPGFINGVLGTVLKDYGQQ